MSLVIVNPSPRAKAPAKKRTTATIRPKAAKGATMAKRHRTPAQKAATRKMLAANRRHRNPAPRRASSKRRVYHRNPAPAARRYTRRRNPSSTGAGSMFKELMSKDGLMQVAAVAVTPTLTELLVSTVMPSATGYTRVAVKAGLGLGLAWAVSKFVSKRVGMVAGLVVAGTAAAELYHAYSGTSNAAAPATTAAYMGAYGAKPTLAQQHRTMKGYSQNEPGLVYLH